MAISTQSNEWRNAELETPIRQVVLGFLNENLAMAFMCENTLMNS